MYILSQLYAGFTRRPGGTESLLKKFDPAMASQNVGHEKLYEGRKINA